MKLFYTTAIALSVLCLFSCSTSKTYFSPQVRAKIENAGVNLNQLQYYVDRDVELKREITKEEAKISNGEVKVENGKYINIITLKKNTLGICSTVFPDKVLISFEKGDNKFLTFGQTQRADAADPYKLLAFEWYPNGDGMIRYEGKSYRITNGTQGSIMIQSKFVKKADQVNKRKMEGVKVSSN